MSEDRKKNFSTGLWKRTSKAGNVYLGGSLHQYWVNYFKVNKPDKTDSDPDGMLKLHPKDKEGTDLSISVSMWRRESKAGNIYITGKRDNKRFNIFANAKKTHPKAPDYHLVIFDLSDEPVQQREVSPEPEMPANPKDDPERRGRGSGFDEYPDASPLDESEYLTDPEEEEDVF